MHCVTVGWGLCVLVGLCLVPLVFTAYVARVPNIKVGTKYIKITVQTGSGAKAAGHHNSFAEMTILMDRGLSDWVSLDNSFHDDQTSGSKDVYTDNICDCGRINGFVLKLLSKQEEWDWFVSWAAVMDVKSEETDGAACYLDDWMGPHDMSACMSKDNPNLSHWDYRLRKHPYSCFEVGNVRRLRAFRWGGTKLQNLTSRFYYSSKINRLGLRYYCKYWVKVNPGVYRDPHSVVKYEGKWKVKTVDQEDAPEICTAQQS